MILGFYFTMQALQKIRFYDGNHVFLNSLISYLFTIFILGQKSPQHGDQVPHCSFLRKATGAPPRLRGLGERDMEILQIYFRFVDQCQMHIYQRWFKFYLYMLKFYWKWASISAELTTPSQLSSHHTLSDHPWNQYIWKSFE